MTARTTDERALLNPLLDDLAAESADLDARLTPLDDDGWSTPTSAAGWDDRDSVNHLAATDEDALLALTDRAGFDALLGRLVANGAEDEQEVADALRQQRAPHVVRGPALDFCLPVTQRRHRNDLALEVKEPVAQEWVGIAQAFAGPSGSGREPQR